MDHAATSFCSDRTLVLDTMATARARTPVPPSTALPTSKLRPPPAGDALASANVG
jgi:hypothetical protein